MTASTIVAIVVVLAAIALVAIWYATTRHRRTEALRDQYGAEYARTVGEVGSRRAAEDELVKRRERVEHFDIRPLSPQQREIYAQQWRDVQALFVDDPGVAVGRADALVEQVMKTRGYPVADFEQRAADLSVHHARFVQNYRAARDVALRHRQGSATTEELRRAMVYYRELFEDLLEDHETAGEREVERPVARDVEPAADDGTRDAAAARAERRRSGPPVAPPNEEIR